MGIVDTKLFKIINEHKIKNIYKQHTGISCKLKYGIPVKDVSIKSISWKVRICRASSFPNAIHFIGVVSNRTSELDKSPFSPSRLLKDSYGIPGNAKGIYHAAKASENQVTRNTYGNFISDRTVPISQINHGYKLGDWVT